MLLLGRGVTLSRMFVLRPTTDGLVVIRPPEPGESEDLIAGRDEVFHRFLGQGSEDPRPAGCIVVEGEIVGWVDYDIDREWLEPGAVNVGYNVFAPHRGQGYGSRAVQLLMHHLAVDTGHRTATLLIHPRNDRSLALAARTLFRSCGALREDAFFKRPVPPLSYTDGVVTIRRQRAEDLDTAVEAMDDEQIDWLWLPGQRASWKSMSPQEQRGHALEGLRVNRDAFGTGPKWTFAVDARDADAVGYVDCDLANDHAPHGEAHISYYSHPAHRGRGYVSRAVRLIMRFLHEHTGVRRAHIIVDAGNLPSLRVAAAVGAIEAERWSTGDGRSMIRHVRAV